MATGPFTPGEMSASQAAKLNDLWESVQKFKRLTAKPPFTFDFNAGIPTLGSPFINDLLLCEVTDNDGETPPLHTVKRKTRPPGSSNTIDDSDPGIVFDNVLNPAGEAWDDETLIGVTKFPDAAGYRWGFPVEAGAATRFGFFASLTTSSTNGGTWSPARWKYFRLTLNSSGVYVFDGAVSAAFDAVPSAVYGADYANPVAGLVVWMWQSKQSGFYEFLPVGYADATGSYPTHTYYSGLVKVGTQVWAGAKYLDGDLTIRAQSPYGDGDLTADGSGKFNANFGSDDLILYEDGGTGTDTAFMVDSSLKLGFLGHGAAGPGTTNTGYAFTTSGPVHGNDGTSSWASTEGAFVAWDVLDGLIIGARAGLGARTTATITRGVLYTQQRGAAFAFGGISGTSSWVTIPYLGGTYGHGVNAFGGPIYEGKDLAGTNPHYPALNKVFMGGIYYGGAIDIAGGGTGATTAAGAINALLPSQGGNAGEFLTTDGTDVSWAPISAGTVTSVDGSGGTTGLTLTGGPITTTGTLTLGGTLGTANGGTEADLSSGTGVLQITNSGDPVTLGAVDLSSAFVTGLVKPVNGGTGTDLDATGPGIVVQASAGADLTVDQESVADLTNNVTSGGTNDQVDDWSDLATYSNDAAAIRNAVYQLARKVDQAIAALKALGAFA